MSEDTPKVQKVAKVSGPKKKDLRLLTTTLALSGLSSERSGRRLQLLLYGPPGTWKTVNAHHMPRTRTLDLDDGLQSVEWAILAGKLPKTLDEIVYRTILPPHDLDDKKNHVLQEAQDQLDFWLAEEDIPPEEWDRPYGQFWDTLVVDSLSALTEASIIHGLRENNRIEMSLSWGKMTIGGVRPMKVQDWGAASLLFMKFINYCRNSMKNVVLVAHEYADTDSEGGVIAYQPKVIGQLRQDLPKDFDEVWYARIKGTKNDAKGIFQTQPDPLRRLRSRIGCLEPVEPAEFGDIKRKIAKFYKIPEESLWRAAHGSEERAEMIEAELEETIDI